MSSFAEGCFGNGWEKKDVESQRHVFGKQDEAEDGRIPKLA